MLTAQQRNKTEVLVKAEDVKDPRTGKTLEWDDWQLSADMEYVLFTANSRKQWRHSSHANRFVHRLKDHSTFALQEPHDYPIMAYAKWSPVGHSVAFVSENDLYVVPGKELETSKPKAIRVTFDGSDVVFNGVPDWVYEEEVFSTDGALWWSPQADTIAYLRSNESAVEIYDLQIFNPTDDAFNINPYTSTVQMRYPKPGTPNPLVSVHTFSLTRFEYASANGVASSAAVSQAKSTLTWPDEYPQDDRIITEVGWVGNDTLLVKEVDRPSRKGHVAVFTGGKSVGEVTRKLGKEGEQGDDGWIDHGQNIVKIETRSDGSGIDGYLDIVPNAEGYDHIALYAPVTASKPVWVTEGEWEVTSIAGVDREKGVAYFVAANPSIDRHLYAVTLPSSPSLVGYKPEMTPLTDVSAPGYYDVSFSPSAGFYSLNYRGPNIPWQRLKSTDETLDVVLEDNAALNATIAEFHQPVEIRSTLQHAGNELNMMTVLPPNLDPSGRKHYPLFINMYAGPGSQTVDNRWKIDWFSFLACEHKYVIARIDGRGTGFKGRKLRNPVMDNLGQLEAEDQAALAREMIKRKFVDRSRAGLFGWSYGGYATAKTLEAYPDLFTAGISVAPVTDWRFYDSVYTERYMNTLSANLAGYQNSSVHNVSAFQGQDWLLAHGTGDDNVHFANMASLIDKLTQERIRGWSMRVFTDSDHSINTRGANRELYEWMTEHLLKSWGKGGNIKH